ncbi:hypothetical protein E2C01_087377 [Portunus trituberculatus]|uniref:Uncharacterized protein n=1 Tax=Portunus trituberculatus TaxID=210409 RepID=A0A5B7JG12_PORTR|nr:hypothetical protein [Portunus trituberculatus]
MVRNGEGLEWDVRRWKREIDERVKCMGLSEWRSKMEQKSTLEWYREEEAPIEGTVYGCECKELQVVRVPQQGVPDV